MQQLLLHTYAAANADSTEARYRALRERYLGLGSYDFGEVPLADLASAVAERGNRADALRFHALNVEMNPRSTFALRQLAQAHLGVGDTARAIAAYERALSINAADGQSRRALEALRRTP